MTLAERWPGSAAWWQRLAAAYSEPHRRYHTLAHLEHLFAEAAPFEPLSPALDWALWFHDYVYDPHSARNEEASADVAAAALAEMGADEAVIARTRELILATRHQLPSEVDDETVLLISLDLLILAADAARYDAYTAEIRAEYAHVSDEDFRRGRGAFLRSFLERPQLFPHPAFASREAAARTNLARELKALT